MNGAVEYTPMLTTMRDANADAVERIAIATAIAPREFKLVIEGEPVPKLQGQILKLGKHMSIKKNPRTRAYEDIVRQRATVVWDGRPLIADTPITMRVI